MFLQLGIIIINILICLLLVFFFLTTWLFGKNRTIMYLLKILQSFRKVPRNMERSMKVQVARRGSQQPLPSRRFCEARVGAPAHF